MLEILTPEWQYTHGPKGDFENILQVKEQRRLGTSRGGTCTPQAPVIAVRMDKASIPSKYKKVYVKADLWCYGPSLKGKNQLNRQDPDPVGRALTNLRVNTTITCTENIAQLETKDDDKEYCHAELKCFVTRGARVYCRKHHVALRLSVVHNVDGSYREVESVPCVRTARLSISEKAMCPRESDRKRKPFKPDSSQAQKKAKLDAFVKLEPSEPSIHPHLIQAFNPTLMPYLATSLPRTMVYPNPDLVVRCIDSRSASKNLVENLLVQTQGALTVRDPKALKALSGNCENGAPVLYPPSFLFS